MRARRVDSNHKERPLWRCAQCGIAALPTAHQMRHTYCSKACMAAGYSARMVGDSNPNFRGAGWKVCAACGNDFHTYNSARKYCSQRCYHGPAKPVRPPKKVVAGTSRTCNGCGESFIVTKERRKARTCGKPECVALTKARPSAARRQPVPAHVCTHCGTTYHTWEKGRLFCSYPCFVASGGPFRAGLEASRMSRKYGAKKDANHNDMVKALEEVGAEFLDMSTLGHGAPDGAAFIQGAWQLVEFKNKGTSYGRRGLNPIQRKWLSMWKGSPVYILHNVEQAKKFGAGDLSAGEKVTPEECREWLAQQKAEA